MATKKTPGKPTTRRYTDGEKAQAVRLVRQLTHLRGPAPQTVQHLLPFGARNDDRTIPELRAVKRLTASARSEAGLPDAH